MLHALRRALIAVLVPAALAVALGAASAAQAECPEGACVPGGGGTHTYRNTLTVTKSTGTVTSSPAGIDCGTDCTHVDQQIVTCDEFECPEPDPAAWDTLTLTASNGPSGFAPSWSGCASVTTGQCTVSVDATKTVSLAWVDAQNPTVSLTGPQNGAAVGPNTFVSANASDNAGVKRVDFFVEGVLAATDTTAPYGASVSMAGHAHGSERTVSAVAVDTSNRTSTPSERTVIVDKEVGLTVGALPAFTNGTTVPVSIATDVDADMLCKIVGAAPVACDPPTWSGVTGSTPDGSYTYEIRATDAVGNNATVTRSFVLDRTDPEINGFDGPTEGSIVGTDRVTFTFAASDANLQSVRCKVGSAAPAPCTGATSHEITGLTDGTVTFALIVTDKAGNEITRTRTFQVQRPGTGGTGGGAQTTTTTTSGTTEPSQGGQTGPQAARLKVIAAKLAFRRQRRAGRTRLTGLRLTGVPRGATITAKCKGGKKKGCPRKGPKAIRRSGTVKLAALARLRLRKGAVLTITVAASGYAPKTLTARI